MRPDLSHGHRRPLHPAPAARDAVRPTPLPAVPVTSPERLRSAQPIAQSASDVPSLQAGRRSAPRLRLSLPARLIAVEKAHTCILLNLSRTGAQVAILDAMREGEGALLRCGVINAFAIVTRSEFGLNALMFDEPLTDEEVLETRRYHENFEEREKRALIETARKWATGDTSDDRPL
ncbi:MAG: PilZ domain-containing protein [Erythrobacter sp.]